MEVCIGEMSYLGRLQQPLVARLLKNNLQDSNIIIDWTIERQIDMMVHSGEYLSAYTAAATYHWSLLKNIPEGSDYLINRLINSLRRIPPFFKAYPIIS